jgi:glycosyltransferase involved in cell wall biosynthesis
MTYNPSVSDGAAKPAMKSLSMIVPALNEEGDLEDTINMITTVMFEDSSISDYEILIVDDGSQDQTGKIADRLAHENSRIKPIHNHQTMGLGYSYRKGLEQCKQDYVGWLPGKNSIPKETFTRMLAAVGAADFVLVYIQSETRNYFRQVISKAFTLAVNLLFGLNIKYYNGPCIYRSDVLKSTRMTTNGFAFMAEINVRLLKAGHSYVEVGLNNRDRTQGSSKAFVLRNFLRVVNLVTKLFWEIQIRNRFNRDLARSSDYSGDGTKTK